MKTESDSPSTPSSATAEGGEVAAPAAAETPGAVRCSAWLGVADDYWILLHDPDVIHEAYSKTAKRISDLRNALPEVTRPKRILVKQSAPIQMFIALLDCGLPVAIASIPARIDGNLMNNHAIVIRDVVRNS